MECFFCNVCMIGSLGPRGRFPDVRSLSTTGAAFYVYWLALLCADWSELVETVSLSSWGFCRGRSHLLAMKNRGRNRNKSDLGLAAYWIRVNWIGAPFWDGFTPRVKVSSGGPLSFDALRKAKCCSIFEELRFGLGEVNQIFNDRFNNLRR